MTPTIEASDALAELAALRNRRPRSIERLYGKRGPTPEQRAEYDVQVREWNRQYRAAQKRYKAATQ